jgi:cyclopropane-fatty-acyl-phospholipid synthase
MADTLRTERKHLLGELFHDYSGPVFAIRLWNGWHWASLPGERQAFTVVVTTPAALATFVTNPNEVTLGEAFIHREIEIEGDIFSAFFVAEYLASRPRSLLQRAKDLLLRTVVEADRLFHIGAQHSKARDRTSISFHYDQPVEFFRPWLGTTLAYSCAYFHTATDSLDLAQTQKLDLICRKLRLQPQEEFLDIGCGWGSLIMHAAGRHDVRAHGITLSKIQAEASGQRIAAASLGAGCTVELRDYRECEHLAGSFDKIASVGMYEHVGLKNLPCYFHAVHKLLRPGGAFLNHGIARSPLSSAAEDSFIDRYVFPDGRLVTLSQAITAAEAAGFEVRDVENLREHYELTLRKWVEALRDNEDEARKWVSEATFRIWVLYMAGSAAAFRRGDIAIYQVLFSRPKQGQSRFPLVREDWYAASDRGHNLEASSACAST